MQVDGTLNLDTSKTIKNKHNDNLYDPSVFWSETMGGRKEEY